MADTNEALKIWQALQPMIDKEIAEQTESCVRAKKMIVKRATQENESGKGVNIGVMEPFGEKVIIPSGTQLSNVNPGEPVWVYWYLNNASTMHVALTGDGSQGTADTDRLAEMLEKEIADREAALDGLKDQITQENEKIYSYIDKTSSRLRLEFTDDLNGLRSYLEMTASHLRIEFQDDLNSMRSYLEMTASHLRIAFEDGLNSMRSYLELTASHLRLEFYNDMDSLRSYLEMTASHLRVEFADDVNSLRSYLELTASALRLAFENDVESLRSYLELTASHLRLEFDNDMESLRSYLEMTASQLRIAFDDDINSLRSYVDIQAGKIEMNVAATDENSSILRQAGLQLDPNGVLIYANTGDNALGTKYIQSAKEIITYGKWREDHPDGTRAEYETYIAQNAGGIVMSYVAPNNIKNLINLSTDGVLIQANQVNLSSYLGKSEVVITDDSIRIGSQYISLEGYVKATELEAELLRGYDIDAGSLVANSVNSTYGSFDNITTDAISVNGQSVANALKTLGPATSSGGQITIPYTTIGGGSGSVNFNIADTQFYKGGVAAARTAGYTQGQRDWRPDNIRISGKNVIVLNAASDDIGGPYSAASIYEDGAASVTVSTVAWDAPSYTEPYYYETPFVVILSNGERYRSINAFSARKAYNAGANSVVQRKATQIGTILLSRTDTGDSIAKTATVFYDNGTTTANVPVTISGANLVYAAGQNSVNVSGWSVDKSGLPTVTVTVTLSNGVVRSHSFNV